MENLIGPPPDHGYLVVRLAKMEYGVPEARVVAMQKVRSAHIMVLGEGERRRLQMELHGRIVPLVSPYSTLGFRERPLGARSSVLLIGSAGETRPERTRFALLVESVSRIVKLYPHEVSRDTAYPWSEGRVKLGPKWREVLDVEYLLRSSETPFVASQPDREGVEERSFLNIAALERSHLINAFDGGANPFK